MDEKIDVSVIIPVKNAGKFLNETFEGILEQSAVNCGVKIEVCVFDDGSDDDTWKIIEDFENKFLEKRIYLRKKRICESGGVGYAKNQAIQLSSGNFLCFNDADDVSDVDRIRLQLDHAKKLQKSTADFIFLGSKFHRFPGNSTTRYTNWANSINDEDLKNQVYTSNGPTLVAPTWFISRSLYLHVGKFKDDEKTGFPEDLEFFYRCLDVPSCVFSKVPVDCIMYRYHPGCASFGVNEKSIWKMRFQRLREKYLKRFDHFTIWSAGKQGKQFFKSLNEEEKSKVSAFCDIDVTKISRGVHEEFDPITRKITHRIPIIRISDAKPPLIVCVKLDMTGGDLEKIIETQGWVEDKDLIYFG